MFSILIHLIQAVTAIVLAVIRVLLGLTIFLVGMFFMNIHIDVSPALELGLFFVGSLFALGGLTLISCMVDSHHPKF